MIFNRRTEICDYLVTQLKLINGADYINGIVFTTNLFNNVYRRLKFIDQINDFPAIYVSAGTEIRNFHTENLTEANLSVTIRIYVYGEDNSQDQSNELIDDIEKLIYSIGDNPDKGILDITIENITIDDGVGAPYGMAEVELSITYRLEN